MKAIQASALVDTITDSYDSKEVILTWWDDEPIEIHHGKLQLPQFILDKQTSHTCVEAYKTGNHHRHYHVVTLQFTKFCACFTVNVKLTTHFSCSVCLIQISEFSVSRQRACLLTPGTGHRSSYWT